MIVKIIAKTTPHTTKNHDQLARRAIVDASTCPKIPATKNAADIAPIALTLHRGATASVKYANATGANPDAAAPWSARSPASIGSDEAPEHRSVTAASTPIDAVITFLRP